MSLEKTLPSFFYELMHSLLSYFFDTFYNFTASGNYRNLKAGGIIFAANHVSFYDPPAIGLKAQRTLNYFARDTLFKGLAGTIIRNLNAIPVNRESADIKSIKMTLGVLKKGGSIVIFPEGTRSSNDKLQEPKPGTGMIACKSKATIVPTRIFGTFEAFGVHKKLPILGNWIHVSFGQPVPVNTLDPGPKHPERYLEISRRIMSEIAKLKLPKQTIV